MTKPAGTNPKPERKPLDASSLWACYQVRWDFDLGAKLCGSVPADPELVKKWLEARQPTVKPPGARSIQEINEEVLATIERGEEFSEPDCAYLVFQSVDGVLYQRAGTVRAHFKDCARVISNQHVGQVTGERAFSTRVINGVYLDETQYWLPILRPDGTPVRKADGAKDKPIHVRTPQGMKSALKRFDWIYPARLDFTLKVLLSIGSKPSVAEEDLDILMTYGGVHGYAGERGDGEGRYRYSFQRIK